MPLINYFTSFPSLPVHLSFACRHLACIILDIACATPSRIRQVKDSAIHKTCTGSNDRFGIKVEEQGFAHPFSFVDTYDL
mgnify:FL=1